MNNIPCVGDKVQEFLTVGPKNYNEKRNKKTGTIVYVHPKYYFYTVEFELEKGKVRESYEVNPCIRNKINNISMEIIENKIKRM